MLETHDVDSLLRRLGERIAGTCSQVLPVLDPASAEARALTGLEELGVQLQALERVIGGHGRLAPEHVDLGLAMVQLRAERAHALQQRGATIDGPTEGADVRISAGVLKQALDLALDHALALGPHVDVRIGREGHPALPTLQLAIPQPFMELFGASPDALDELHWTLLAVLCNRCGIRLERDVQAHQVVLSLGFVPAA